MTSNTVTVFANTRQVWDLIERDFTLRLSLIAEEWSTDYLKAWNGVFREGQRRSNSAYHGPAWVDMAIEEMEKRAAWSYQTCCEIWDLQGRPKSRPFFRAIFDCCLQPMFAGRHGCFKQKLDLHRKRTGLAVASNFSTIGGHMARQMGKLRARWNTLLEIATRDAEHQERLNRKEENKAVSPSLKTQRVSQMEQAHGSRWQTAFVIDPSRSAASGSPFTWRELEIRFQEIQAKSTPRETVNVDWARTEFESGAISEEWALRGNLGLKAEFEALASIAAQKLGYAQNECASNQWLGRVRAWMRQSRLDKDPNFVWNTTGSFIQDGVAGNTQRFISTNFADLSAKFCMSLMARGTPEDTTRQPVAQPEAVASMVKPGRTMQRKPMTRAQLSRATVIFGAIESRLEGIKYCDLLDSRRLPLPNEWKDDGCPANYKLAYLQEKWRKRIQDEKSRYGRKYNLTPESERKAIIQGARSTRQTRN